MKKLFLFDFLAFQKFLRIKYNSLKPSHNLLARHITRLNYRKKLMHQVNRLSVALMLMLIDDFLTILEVEKLDPVLWKKLGDRN